MSEPTGVPRGASAWEAAMIELMTTHVAKERGLVESYQRLANETGSKAFRYVVELLVDDEIRHHRHFLSLADAIKADAEMRTGEPAIPDVDFDRVDRAKVLEATEALRDNEREDLKLLRQLTRELRSVEETTLWSLLVDIMERDTEKHIAILDFVRRLAKHA
jgi:hypothetical protein